MGLNRDSMPIVNINSRKTEELLEQILMSNQEMPRDIGDGYITFKKGGVTYRIKKNGN